MFNPASADLSLDSWGGLVSDMTPADLPDGVSPDCQDVAFVVGSVKTRPGLLSLFAAIGGNPTINYLKTFTEQNLTELLLALDSTGALWQAQSNALTQINTGVGQAIVAGARGKSATLFGREYIALGDGKFGIDIPRQYDATFFDRISQVGPGAAPAIQDANTTANITASPNGLLPVTDTTAASSGTGQTGVGFFIMAHVLPAGTVLGDKIVISGANPVSFNGTWQITYIASAAIFDAVFVGGAGPGNNVILVSSTVQYPITTVVTTASFPGAVVGQMATIAGAGVAGYNATWTVRSVTSLTNFTITGAALASLAASGNGTITGAGNISAGPHQLSVLFVTRQGALLRPSPPITWTAAGNLGALAANIPIGPANIKQRILAFTVAAGANFYYLPAFVINDNITTSLNVNFTDAALAAGTQINAAGQNLFLEVELGEVSGIIGYANRLAAWGERNKINNFVNLTFDGGWNLAGGLSSSDVPLGWTQSASGAGGSKDSANVVWGDAYRITGDGATAVRGQIQQSCFQDYLNVRVLSDQVAYSVRVKAIKGGGIAQGTLTIDVNSPSQGTLGTFTVNLGNILTTGFTEFIGALVTAQNIPSDAVIRCYVSGTPTNAGWITIDNIEVYPTNQPYNSTQVRVSSIFANFNGPLPEGFDGVSGVLQFNQTAEPVRTAFVLTDRSSLTANDHVHFVKPNGIWRSQDNGGLPSTWSITQVSGTIGSPSVDGVDVGEDWVVIAHPSGLYLYYFGSEPNKISQEIQPLWNRINWTGAGHTVWVRVDTLNKRILVGAPFDAAVTPNKVLALDYRGLISASQIIETPPVHFSSYSGKMIALGLARKWAPWTISANCAYFETPNANLQVGAGGVYFGNSVGNGKIYNLQDAQLSDDGVAIPSYYQTYYFPSQIQEPILKLRSHRKLFSYLTGFAEGAGSLTISAFLGSSQFSNPLPSLNLINTAAPATITAIKRQAGLLTVTCGSGHGLTAGVDLAVVIAGTNDASMNGMFPIKQILSLSSFTVSQIGLPDSFPAVAGTVGRLLRDFEMATNLVAERVSYKFATSALNSWFRLEKLSPSLQNDPWSPVRGGM